MSFEGHWSLYISLKEPKMETSLERDAARRRTLGRLLRNFVSGRGRMEGCLPVPVWMWPLHLEGCVSTYFYCDRCGSTIIWVLGRPLWNKPIKNPLKTRPCHELAALRLGRRLIAPPARESGHQGGMQRSPWTGRGRRLRFIQPSLSSTESTMRCCLLVGVSMKRGAAFLRAVPQIPRAAVRPCALTQNNHAIIFVAIAKNEGKVAKVVPSWETKGERTHNRGFLFPQLFPWTICLEGGQMQTCVKVHSFTYFSWHQLVIEVSILMLKSPR